MRLRRRACRLRQTTGTLLAGVLVIVNSSALWLTPSLTPLQQEPSTVDDAPPPSADRRTLFLDLSLALSQLLRLRRDTPLLRDPHPLPVGFELARSALRKPLGLPSQSLVRCHLNLHHLCHFTSFVRELESP